MTQTQEIQKNLLWLDNLLFIIQIKERNIDKEKSEESDNNWFRNKVVKKATKQISNSINFLKQNNITVKNAQNHSIAINVSEQDLRNAHKVIIYMPRNSLIDKDNRSIKFYTSKKSGNIHIFNIDDYRNICNALITPSELDEYLKFRDQFVNAEFFSGQEHQNERCHAKFSFPK